MHKFTVSGLNSKVMDMCSCRLGVGQLVQITDTARLSLARFRTPLHLPPPLLTTGCSLQVMCPPTSSGNSVSQLPMSLLLSDESLNVQPSSLGV